MAEEDDKPGMGVSGAAAGVVGLGVGTLGTAGIAHTMRRGQLTDEAKEKIGKRSKIASDAEAAFKEANKGDGVAQKYAETTAAKMVADAEAAGLKTAAETDAAIAEHLKDASKHQEIYNAALVSAQDKKIAEAADAFTKAHPDAKAFDVKAFGQKHLKDDTTGIVDGLEKMGKEDAHAQALSIVKIKASEEAEKAFKAANPDVGKHAEAVAARAKDVAAKAVTEAGKKNPVIKAYATDKTKFDAILNAGAEHAGIEALNNSGLHHTTAFKSEAATKIREAGEKAYEAAATKPTGVANKAEAGAKALEAELGKITAVKDASWYKKPFVAFKGMGTGGKALAIGLGAVIGLGALMAVKSSRQNAWQERIDEQRATATTAPQPAR